VFATNDVLTANDLNALAGAWNSYTPTLAGFTPGNGTAAGAYLQFGKFVSFRARFVFGSTSAATTNVPTLTLPVTASANAPFSAQSSSVTGCVIDANGSTYASGALLLTTTTAGLLLLGTNGVMGTFSTTSPFTWTTSDALVVSGTYEAA
jgi:hypothetical protein